MNFQNLVSNFLKLKLMKKMMQNELIIRITQLSGYYSKFRNFCTHQKLDYLSLGKMMSDTSCPLVLGVIFIK